MGFFDFLTGHVDPKKIGNYYDDAYANVSDIDTSFQQNMGEQMFDPNSKFNQGMRNSFMQNASDMMGVDNLQNSRMAAMGRGLGATERMQATAQKARAGAQAQFQQSLGQSAQIGSGLLGQSLQGNMANQGVQQQMASEKAGAMATQASQNAQNKAGLGQAIVGGITGGLMQFGLGALKPPTPDMGDLGSSNIGPLGNYGQQFSDYKLSFPKTNFGSGNAGSSNGGSNWFNFADFPKTNWGE